MTALQSNLWFAGGRATTPEHRSSMVLKPVLGPLPGTGLVLRPEQEETEKEKRVSVLSVTSCSNPVLVRRRQCEFPRYRTRISVGDSSHTCVALPERLSSARWSGTER